MAIYNEERNCWHCEKCDQEFSESDVFIQDLEECEIDPTPKPSVDYILKKKEKTDAFLEDSASLFKRLGRFRIVSRIFYVIEFALLAVLFYKMLDSVWFASLISLFILLVTIYIARSIPGALCEKIRDKAMKCFDEVKEISGNGWVCDGKSCKMYFSIADLEEGKTYVKYRCEINKNSSYINDFTLGYWHRTRDSKNFVALGDGFGLRRVSKLRNKYFMMIFKDGFQAAPQNHTFSCQDYLSDADFAGFKVGVSDEKALSAWKIGNLKSVLNAFDELLGGSPFAIAIENTGITALFLSERTTFVYDSYFEYYDTKEVSDKFSMLYDLVEMTKLLNSVEVEEEILDIEDPVPESKTESQSNGFITKRRPTWVRK